MQPEKERSSQEGETQAASDAVLLRRFVREGRQAAFSELVARYSGLVYSTCMRDVRDAAVAEDAAQAVFLLLARKAGALSPETPLAGWLYRTARLVSRNAARQEARVRIREQRLGQHLAVEGSWRPPAGGDEPWRQLEPALHAALDALGRQEQEAILLRFFEGRSLAETGAALGLSEDAARMRVSRSLEKLRRRLFKADVVLPTALLAGLLGDRAVHAAPAALQHFSPLPAPGTHAPAGPASIPRAYRLAQGATRMMWINKAIVTGGLIGAIVTGGVVGTLRVPHAALSAQDTAVPTAPDGTGSAQDVIAQSAAATRALRSLQADLSWTLSAGGAKAKVAESFTVQRPNFARLDPDARDGHTERTVADGRFVWRFSPDTPQVAREPDAPDGQGIGRYPVRPGRPGRDVDVFVRFFFDPSLMGLRVGSGVGTPTLRSAGEETRSGRHYQVVALWQEAQQAGQKPEPSGEVGSTTLAFFGDDHLLHRIQVTTLFYDGTVSNIEASLSNIKANVPIAVSRFVPVLPQKAVVVDSALTPD